MMTGGALITEFRDKMSKVKDVKLKTESEFDVGYSTGFLNFDFMNGTVVHVKSEDRDFKYYSVGLTDGSMIMVIGRSGCGKSTLVMQMAANIVKPFTSSCIFSDEIEAGVTSVRREVLTGFFGEELNARFVVRNTGINAENFYERIRMIHDMKTTDRAAYEYDTGLFDSMGNRLFKLEPTVYILDSLAMLMPDKFTEEEELSGQMSSTAAAKANAMIFKRIVPMLKSANIMLFIINHILDDVSINPMMKKKAQVSYLKQGETLPGGKTPTYLSNTLIRVDDKTKLKDSEGLGINGSMIDLTLVKSRTNRAGRATTMVFDQNRGFDPELSLFVMLKEHNRIGGAGAYLYIGDRNDMKFTQKAFKQKLQESPEFNEIFMSEVIDVLKSNMSYTDIDRTVSKSTIATDILSKINVFE